MKPILGTATAYFDGVVAEWQTRRRGEALQIALREVQDGRLVAGLDNIAERTDELCRDLITSDVH